MDAVAARAIPQTQSPVGAHAPPETGGNTATSSPAAAASRTPTRVRRRSPRPWRCPARPRNRRRSGRRQRRAARATVGASASAYSSAPAARGLPRGGEQPQPHRHAPFIRLVGSVDVGAGSRERLQPLRHDRFSGDLVDPVAAIVEPLQRGLDLGEVGLRALRGSRCLSPARTSPSPDRPGAGRSAVISPVWSASVSSSPSRRSSPIMPVTRSRCASSRPRASPPSKCVMR